MKMLFDFIKLCRPHQWTKNLFIFAPAFFAFRISEIDVIQSATITFIAYSLFASAVYVFNDWVDRHDDSLHPVKRNRPIASGRISTIYAILLTLFLILTGYIIATSVSLEVSWLLSGYLALNLGYTLKIKQIAIMDIATIATGFVIRLLAGAAATQVELSHWIIVMTFLLALFLSLAKRRDDVNIFLSTQQRMRKSIDGYNLPFLDSAIVMTASMTLVAYILWSISPDVAVRLNTDNAYLTSVFVLLGMMRYMQIALVEEKSGSPSEVLIQDRFIQLTLLAWIGTFIFLLYGSEGFESL